MEFFDDLKYTEIMPSTRQFGYKRGNLSGLNSVRGLPKRFLTAVAKVAA
jgi:hypothetical protein